jgi:YHS domain-containing protein
MTYASGIPRLLFRPIVCLAVSFVVLVGLARPLMAGSEINTGYFGNVAIKGYDPVAYFTEDKAMKGSEDHALKWLGANWQFTSDAHKQAFAADPTKYAPQYGGHCALGASSNHTTNDIDPEAWAIIDGKLYLNYSKAATKLLSEKRIAKADANWPELRKRLAQ